MKMRIFIAAAFDSCTKEKISDFYDELRKAGVIGHFTPANNLHLTLKFLGEVEHEQIDPIKAALDSAARGFHAFDLKSEKCGYFNSRGEKTIWLGMNAECLSSLAEAVDIEVSRLGFECERRSFTPHVTLARRASYDGRIQDLPALEITTPVNGITLFESRRDRGLWYKPLYKAEFD